MSVPRMFSRSRDVEAPQSEPPDLRRERDAFIETAYLHINEPLGAVVGLAELLRDRTRDFNAGVRNEVIDLLAMHATEASRVMNDLLVVAKFDMDRMELKVGTVELRSVVDAATTGWASRQKSRLTVSGDVLARGDEEWVTHIVGNLLRNAAAHGGDNIWVRMSEGRGRAHVEVIDDGAGVPPELAPHIFEPYFSSPGKKATAPSLGLGLHVARRLARAMGGDVQYSREGTRTVFTLSLTGVNLQAVSDRPTDDRVIDPFAGKPTRFALDRIVAEGGPQVAYQPVIDLRSRAEGDTRVMGFEALARFPDSAPPLWFEAAAAHGLRVDLELAAIRAGVAGFVSEPATGFLALNLSDATLTSSRLFDALQGVDPGRVVLELSEGALVRSYEETRRHIDSLRESGIRLAIDDVGAGEIDMWHMLRLSPDVIKIDMSLVRDVQTTPRNRALIRGITAMGQDLGVMVVAEGIESGEEESQLLELGVRYGQGYRFGKPGALQWKTRVLADQ